MSEVGTAFVSILPSSRNFGRALEGQVGGEIDGAGKSMGSRFGNLFKVGALAALGGAALAGKFLHGAIDEAREAQVVTARTENVIKKMGNAAGISANQVAKLAGSISAKTGIDDEAIQSGQNLLLTFGNIRNEAGKGNDIFNQTSQLMVDMSAAMGTDAKGAAIQLGKALNDPIKGITALTRVGVSFTEQQKAQIEKMVESGNTLGAQKVILGELERQFGGAAAAMATPADKARVAYANLKEQIGTALLPVVDRMLVAFTGAIPVISGIATKVQGAFSGAGGALTAGFQAVVSFVTTALIPSLQNLYAALQPTLVEAFNALKTAAGALVGGLQFIGPALLAATGFIKDHKTAITAVVVTVGTAVAAWKVWQFGIKAWTAVTKAAAAVQAAYNAIMLANPVGLVVVALAALAAGTIYAYKHSATFRGIVDKLWGAIKVAAGWVANMAGEVVQFGKAVVDRIKDVAQFVSGLKDKFGDALDYVKSFPGKVGSALAGLLEVGKHAAAELIRGLLESLTAGISKVKDKVSEIAGAIKGFFPGSPVKEGPLTAWNDGTPGRLLMEMLAKGIDDGRPRVIQAALNMAKELRDKLNSQIDQVKSDMASLAGSVASAFTGNLFEATDTQGFLANLMDTKGQLKQLKAAFKKLLKWGLSPQFLSQLFSSGNGGLILDLAASGNRGWAMEAAQTYGQVQSLSNQLGGQVAGARYGQKLDGLRDELKLLRKDVQKLGKEFGREINGVAASAARGR